MRYLLDKNILSNRLLRNESKRSDLYVLQEVVDEFAFSSIEAARITSSGINILHVSKRHLEKLQVVLSEHGDNLKLINLFRGTGAADVVIIAYVLAERDNPNTLFPEQYTIVTRDAELTKVARSYGLSCAQELI